MALILNEEQQMLKTSAKEFLKERAPVEALRKLRDERSETGFDRQMWNEMAEMGWACLTISESYGGLDFGYVGLGQILEETGRTLTASPLISNVLLGTTAINLAASNTQKEALLPIIAEGKMLVTLALDESTRHNPIQINTTASKEGDSYVLNGKKVMVLDGHVTDKFVVAAKTENGVSLFLVDAKSDGISIQRVIMMDSRNSATLQFENVKISASSLLGEEGQGAATIEKILDIARIGLSAEMVGSMTEAFERTVAYLKERKQFGVPIGSFQALQHRAAQMFCEIELCKSLVLKSLQAIDANEENLPILASMTKAKVSETLQLVSNEGVQMFGGIGMTDDEEIGFFLKRARVAQQTFGDANYHIDRFAKLSGY
ncbi:MAG: acyl-CoA dehydrogenase [Saprospiraceae bacterium]|jgi:acyl-CoA dehydrogenase|nr:acyl-CoA dehydrogenase [Saprospiraceae bacterium]